MKKKMKFGHLHLHTLYSSLDSTVKLEELVKECKKRNIMAVAMTDHGNVAGAYNFYKACNDGGVKPILGCELYLVDNLHSRPNFIQKTIKVTTFKVSFANGMAIEGTEGEGVFVQTGKRKKKTVFRKYEKLSCGDLVFVLPGKPATTEGEIFVSAIVSVKEIKKFTHEELASIKKREREKRLHVVVLAKNWKGFQKLMRLLTIANLEGFYYKPRIDQKTLFEVCDSDVVVMTACTSGLLSGDRYLERAIDFSKKYGDDFYLEMMPLDYKQQYVINNRAIALSARGFGKLVMTNDVHYINKEDAETQEVVLAISQKAKMKWPTEIKDVDNTVKGAAVPSTKVKTRWKFDVNSLYLMTPKEMIESATSIGVKRDVTMECVQSIDEIIGKCNINMGKIKPTLPSPYPDVEDEVQLFKDKVIAGAKQRGFDPEDKEIKARIDKEVEAIISGGFVRYFLIVEDLIIWAKKYMMVGPGRGSVGGCFIAYCLGITEVNPLRWGMIFERFISEGRIDLPDIDMDFQDDKRFMVLKYLENKYGENCVANVANYSKLKGKSALRDACRVYDVPAPVVNRTADIIQTRSTGDARAEYSLMDSLETFEEGKKFKKAYPEVAKHAIKMEGIIRHGGCHAAGVVVSSTDLLLGDQCVIVRRSKYDRVINWDKKCLEFFGLCKLDILGLKTLSVIGETKDRVELAADEDRVELAENEGDSLDVINKTQDRAGLSVSTIYGWMQELDDKRVFKLLREGHTAGVFQFNTYGMKDFVIKMDIDSFKDMYDTSALFRPGTLRTGLAMEYIKRKKGTEKPVFFHPIYEEITKETQGIMLYQEQIMFLLYKLAGIGWRTCDMVRKAISKSQGVEVIRKFKSLFVDGCVENNTLSAEVAGGLFDKIEVFGSYAFNLCVSGDTFIYESIKRSGRRCLKKITIAEAWKKQSGRVRAYNEETGKDFHGSVRKIVKTGKKLVHELRVIVGKRGNGNPIYRVIKTTPQHEFLTDNGWKRLESICPGRDKVLLKRGHYKDKLGENNSMFGRTPWNKGRKYSRLQGGKKIGEFVREKLSDGAKNRKSPSGMYGKRHTVEARIKMAIAAKKPWEGIPGHFFTKPHRVLWSKMIEEGVGESFENEVMIGPYTCDMVDTKRGVVVEVDGDYWHANPEYVSAKQSGKILDLQKANIKRDQEKTSYLQDEGYKVLRFWASDVYKDVDSIVDEISSVVVEYSENPFEFFDVVCVEPVGYEETYDIQMDEKFHNYVANLFVVHNSHAVEYTVISYITALLKIKYPTEFLCAGLNHTSDEKREDLIREAKRLGIEITYPDINLSEGGWSIADGKLVCGLREIANVGPKAVEEILNAREAGLFKDAEDFHNRINRRVVNKRVVENIAKCNAFFNKGENPIDIAESMFKFSLLYDEASMYKQYISVVPEAVRKRVRYITLDDLAKTSLADDGVDLSKVDGIQHFEKSFLVFGKVRDLRYSFTDFKDRENFSKDGYWQHLAYMHFTDGNIYTHISLTKQLYYAKKEFCESLKDKWVFVEIVRFYDQKTGNYFNMSSDVWNAADIFSCDATAKSRLDKFKLSTRRRLGEDEKDRLAKLGEENRSCPMLSECMYARVPAPLSIGKTNILIVGESPGKTEVASGVLFSGQAGVEFWKTMAKYGMKNRCSFCISNVLKCQLEGSITREAPVKKCASAWLEKEIEIIRPAVIFSLGNTPKKFFGKVKGITELAGTVEWSARYKCFIVYGIHPAAVLYHEEYREALEKSVKAFKIMIAKV